MVRRSATRIQLLLVGLCLVCGRVTTEEDGMLDDAIGRRDKFEAR